MTDAGFTVVDVGGEGSVVSIDLRSPTLGHALAIGVGTSQVLQFDGASWAPQHPPLVAELSYLHMVSLSSGVLLAGGGLNGDVFTLDGGSWWRQSLATTAFRQSQRHGDDVDLLTGRELHFIRDGGISTATPQPGVTNLNNFLRTPGGSYWVSGGNALFSGQPGAWTVRHDAGSTFLMTAQFAASADDDVWVSISSGQASTRLFRWNGAALVQVDAGLPLVPLAAFSPVEAIFSVEGKGQLVHFGPNGFTPDPRQGFDVSGSASVVGGTSASDVWAHAIEGPLHFGVGGWRQVIAPAGTRFSGPFAVGGPNESWAWADVPGGLLLYRCVAPQGCTPVLRARSGLSAPRVTSAAGTTWVTLADFNATPAISRVFRLTATGAVEEPSLPSFRDLHANLDGSLWAVDQDTGEVHRLEAGTWVLKNAAASLSYASLHHDEAGTVLLRRCPRACSWWPWNGTAFEQALQPDGGPWPSSLFTGVFPTDMWMLGARRSPELLRVTGGTITPVRFPGLMPDSLHRVGDEVFVGAGDSMLHLRP